MGRHVVQYHSDSSDRTKNVRIVLGKWSQEKHMQHLNENPRKRPSQTDRKYTLFI
jgi:hypothetical protein